MLCIAKQQADSITAKTTALILVTNNKCLSWVMHWGQSLLSTTALFQYLRLYREQSVTDATTAGIHRHRCLAAVPPCT